MIQISIVNGDGSHDLFATVTDLLTDPPTVPMSRKRINRGSREAVTVEEDGDHHCLVTVQTQAADDPGKTGTFPEQRALAGGMITVNVF